MLTDPLCGWCEGWCIAPGHGRGGHAHRAAFPGAWHRQTKCPDPWCVPHWGLAPAQRHRSATCPQGKPTRVFLFSFFLLKHHVHCRDIFVCVFAFILCHKCLQATESNCEHRWGPRGSWAQETPGECLVLPCAHLFWTVLLVTRTHAGHPAGPGAPRRPGRGAGCQRAPGAAAGMGRSGHRSRTPWVPSRCVSPLTRHRLPAPGRSRSGRAAHGRRPSWPCACAAAAGGSGR